MTLSTGTRLGPYEIVARLGAGGMGEVYRARDTRLGRDVAIKIVARAWAEDADRMARFEREARILASLNHPNIATIHEIEDTDGVTVTWTSDVDGASVWTIKPPDGATAPAVIRLSWREETTAASSDPMGATTVGPGVSIPKTWAGRGAVKVTIASALATAPTCSPITSASAPDTFPTVIRKIAHGMAESFAFSGISGLNTSIVTTTGKFLPLNA